MLDQMLVYSTAASVKARSGLGGWTDGQGEQLLFFNHFKTERLECPLRKKNLTENTTIICLVTIEYMNIYIYNFFFFFRKMNPKRVYLTWFSNQPLQISYCCLNVFVCLAPPSGEHVYCTSEVGGLSLQYPSSSTRGHSQWSYPTNDCNQSRSLFIGAPYGQNEASAANFHNRDTRHKNLPNQPQHAG